MLLLPRLAFALVFVGLGLLVPGWLVSRALWTRSRGAAHFVTGVAIVLAVAVGLSLLLERPVTRWTIAASGFACALASTMRLRGKRAE